MTTEQTSQQELNEFIQSLCSFIQQQITVIIHEMSGTVSDVMGKVMELDHQKTDKKKESEQIIVKKSVEKSFEKVNAREYEKQKPNEQANNSAIIVKSSLKEAGKKFREKMKNYDSLNEEIGDFLFKIMGTLSADDMVAQRLEHVSKTLDDIKSIVDNKNINTSSVLVNERIAQTLKSMHSYYTMEEEKICFESIFDKYGKVA